MKIAIAVSASNSREISCGNQHYKDVTQTAPRQTQQTDSTRADRPLTEQKGRQTPTRGGWDIDRGKGKNT